MRNDRLISDLVFFVLVIVCGLVLISGRTADRGDPVRLEGRVLAAEQQLAAAGNGKLERRVVALRKRLDAVEREADELDVALARLEEAGSVVEDPEEFSPREAAKIERAARGSIDRIMTEARDAFVADAVEKAAASAGVDRNTTIAIVGAYQEEQSDIASLFQKARYGGLSGTQLAKKLDDLRARRISRVRRLLGGDRFEAVEGQLPEPAGFLSLPPESGRDGGKDR